MDGVAAKDPTESVLVKGCGVTGPAAALVSIDGFEEFQRTPSSGIDIPAELPTVNATTVF